jgi:nitronate monooxygenase
MIALTNHAELFKAAIQEGIDLIISGAGLPLNLPSFLNGSKKTKLVPIVSSGRAARIVMKKWQEKYDYIPDAVLVEGPLAGGHLGFRYEDINDNNFTLEKLIPEIKKETYEFESKFNKKIPLIAAGGIYTGSDIRKFMKLGADGVQMATRFVTTEECDADIEFKKTYINAKEEDIVVIKSPVGMPGRAIRNEFINAVNRGEKHPFKCPFKCIYTCKVEESPYCIALSLINAQKGNLKHGFAFAGQNAHKATEIITVKTLINRIKEEFAASCCPIAV